MINTINKIQHKCYNNLQIKIKIKMIKLIIILVMVVIIVICMIHHLIVQKI